MKMLSSIILDVLKMCSYFYIIPIQFTFSIKKTKIYIAMKCILYIVFNYSLQKSAIVTLIQSKPVISS